MRGIDLFSGAGGMSVGAVEAGVRAEIAVEFNPQAASTFSKNHPDADVFVKDVREVNFIDFRTNEKTVLFGGPPCQGFSTSNQKTRNSDNQNNWLFLEFLRAVRDVEPDWVLFDNVKGIAETENAKFLKLVIKGLEEIGYVTKAEILNAVDFGVPQTRSRQFVVAAHCLSGFKFPVPKKTKSVTVRDAISDLPYVENGASLDVRDYACEASSHLDMPDHISYASYQKGKARADPHTVIQVLNNWSIYHQVLLGTSCTVPHCGGLCYSALPTKEDLWDKYYTEAPKRQRQCVEQYNIVKRA